MHGITGLTGNDLLVGRGGVLLRSSWRQALQLEPAQPPGPARAGAAGAPHKTRSENDLYALASDVAWEIWFTTRQSFKIEVTAQHSPLQSLNFAALSRSKTQWPTASRAKTGVRPM